MDLQNDLFDIFSGAIKICKEKEYHELQEEIHKSYLELMEVEAGTRREKASAIIKGLQTIDRELTILKFEYGKVTGKYQMGHISAIDEYIATIEKYRKSIVSEKNRLSPEVHKK